MCKPHAPLSPSLTQHSFYLACAIFVYTDDVTAASCNAIISCVIKINEQDMDLPNYSIALAECLILFCLLWNWYLYLYFCACSHFCIRIYFFQCIVMSRTPFVMSHVPHDTIGLSNKNPHHLSADSHSGCQCIYSQDHTHEGKLTVRTQHTDELDDSEMVKLWRKMLQNRERSNSNA